MADCIYNLRVAQRDFRVCHPKAKISRSKIVKYTENMNNELKRMKINFPIFDIFIC